MTTAELLQQTLNGLLKGSMYGLLGVGFGLIFAVTQRFHFAYVTTYALTVYFTITFMEKWSFPFALAAIGGLVAAALIGMLIEGGLYRPIAEKAGGSLFTIFVASLGLTIAGENLIRLVWGSAGRAVDGPDVHRISISTATITGLDLTAALVAWVLILSLWAVLRWTKIGKLITAVRVNPEAARVFGISPERIYLLVLFIGTMLGGVVALHAALKLAATPDMGLAPLVSAFLVVFLGGYTRSPAVLGLTGLLIGLIESLSALWLPPIWAPIVLFGVLLVYIVVKSFDFARLLPKLLTPARNH